MVSRSRRSVPPSSSPSVSTPPAEPSPAERYAAARRRAEVDRSELGAVPRAAGLPAGRLPGRRLPGAGAGQRRAGRGADRRGQDRRRRVRGAPRAGVGPQGVLHDAHQGAVQPEVLRPGPPLRRRPGRSAHRRHHDQRRRTRGRHDHRGAAQHALRGIDDPAGPRVRGHGRGALPRRPVPRAGLGGGDHPPHRRRAAGLAVRDRVQRRGVRRLAGHGPRRHDRGGQRAPARPAGPARPGTRRPAGPVRRPRRPDRARRRPADQPRPARTCCAAATARRWASRAADRGDRGRAAAGAGGGRPGRQVVRRRRFAVVDALDRDGLLPAIVFIFSRAGCQGAVAAVPGRRASG